MKYVCPMHPEISSDKPGKCPKCGMRLVSSDKSKPEVQDNDYSRLFIIIGLILLATIAIAFKDVQSGTFAWTNVMTNFMAGFFLVFSGFKLIDLGGFAEGYSTYDLLASRLFQYGYVYPFIELAFGLAYLTSFHLQLVNILVVIVMGFSGLGVLQTMLKRRKVYCACLGTIIKVPLGTVTLVEDFGMVLMALLLIIL